MKSAAVWSLGQECCSLTQELCDGVGESMSDVKDVDMVVD